MLAFAVRHDPVAAYIEGTLRYLERALDPAIASDPAPLGDNGASIMEAYNRTSKEMQNRLAKLLDRSYSRPNTTPRSGFQRCPKCDRYPRPAEAAIYNNGIPSWHEHCLPIEG
jgi:hypothetical protein